MLRLPFSVYVIFHTSADLRYRNVHLLNAEMPFMFKVGTWVRHIANIQRSGCAFWVDAISKSFHLPKRTNLRRLGNKIKGLRNEKVLKRTSIFRYKHQFRNTESWLVSFSQSGFPFSCIYFETNFFKHIDGEAYLRGSSFPKRGIQWKLEHWQFSVDAFVFQLLGRCSYDECFPPHVSNWNTRREYFNAHFSRHLSPFSAAKRRGHNILTVVSELPCCLFHQRVYSELLLNADTSKSVWLFIKFKGFHILRRQELASPTPPSHLANIRPTRRDSRSGKCQFAEAIRSLSQGAGELRMMFFSPLRRAFMRRNHVGKTLFYTFGTYCVVGRHANRYVKTPEIITHMWTCTIWATWRVSIFEIETTFDAALFCTVQSRSTTNRF